MTDEGRELMTKELKKPKYLFFRKKIQSEKIRAALKGNTITRKPICDAVRSGEIMKNYTITELEPASP